MAIRVVVPPVAVLTLAECKAHLRVEHDDDNDQIEKLARAAEQHFAGPAGTLARSIGLQTLEMATAGFWWWEPLPLPYGPVREVVSITYATESGEATVDDESYRLIGAGTASAKLVLQPGQAWPATSVVEGAVRIQYEAGYLADEVPEPLRLAMLQLTSHWFENREPTGESHYEIPFTVDDLASPFRLWAGEPECVR